MRSQIRILARPLACKLTYLGGKQVFNLFGEVISTNSQGDVAQLGEHRLCKAGVRGSSPLVSTRPAKAGLFLCADHPLLGSGIRALVKKTNTAIPTLCHAQAWGTRIAQPQDSFLEELVPVSFTNLLIP